MAWLSAFTILTAAGASELEVRFENGDWTRPAGVEAITPEVAADGVCFTAPADLPLMQLMSFDVIPEAHVERHLATEETVAPGHEEELVGWVQYRVDANEWKHRESSMVTRWSAAGHDVVSS